VELYYEHGPKAAGFIEGRKRLKGLVRGALYPMAAVCSFALEATAWQKAGVTLMTLLVPFGIIFLVSRLHGRGMLEYKKALCVLLAVVFTFDTVMLGYFGAGGGVKEVQAAVPDGIYFYLNDHLGTPLKMVDEDGAVVWNADYLPFGQATVDPASTVESNWRFPGQYEDTESGLHQNVMRSYSPGLGRYNTYDPIFFINPKELGIPTLIGGMLTTPQELAGFLYSGSNPILYFDKNGLKKCPCDQKLVYSRDRFLECMFRRGTGLEGFSPMEICGVCVTLVGFGASAFVSIPFCFGCLALEWRCIDYAHQCVPV